MLSSMEKNNKPSSTDIQLPPGFRFHPSDEELIVHYLRNKVTSNPLPASVIADIDLYKHNPWDLPNKASFGEEEWYFFTPRDRKYPNGARPNRAAASGFWKATGTDKPILTSCGTKSIGVKKALVFYKGRPPKGYKTDWIMHEYRLTDTIAWTPRRKGSMRLDDWVLCRVRQKGSNPRNTWEDQNNTSRNEASGFLLKVNELWPRNTNPNIEMVKNYLYNDCPMLPYIFASQDFPNCVDTDGSIISIQESEKSCSAIYGDRSNQEENLQFSVSSFDSFFNPLRRKLIERNENDNRFPPSKKIKEIDVEKEEVVISLSNDGNIADMNIYGAHHCDQGNDFDDDHHWSSILEYQELTNLAFTESD